MHDLRRTQGSYQVRTGASLVVVQKALGHKCYQSTTIYARLDMDPVRSAMQRATEDILRKAGVLETEVIDLETARKKHGATNKQ